MKSAIAILTYNRLHALKAELDGLLKHCDYPLAIFDDCGQKDGTETYLRESFLKVADQAKRREDLMADEIKAPHISSKTTAFLGHSNLGVTGNSNRAIKWFMDETDCDHLMLINDDMLVYGDFVDFYARGHNDLDVGLFCFCDFDRASPAISGHPDTYRWITVSSRGWRVKLLPRMTGIMMSMTRKLVETIGYYDSRFGRFGEEHCDYTIRARLAGFINLDGQMQNCLDLEFPPFKKLLGHQDVETSLGGPDRDAANREAGVIMREICKRYGQEPLYRPFALRQPRTVGGHGGFGIPAENLQHYKLAHMPA